MRHLIVVLIALFGIKTAQGQIFEVGPYVGGSNFIGDVGSTKYINPNNIAFGGIFKWNHGPRHSWRASVIHTNLKADDADSGEERRRARGYSFTNGLTEVNLGMEFDFWEWDIFAPRQKITPYLSTGAAFIFTHDMYVNSENELQEEGNKFGFALPMIIGVKGRLSRDLVLAVEIGARMTFYDNLDGSNPKEFSGGNNYPSFGNENTKDWYMFTGLTLTYTFGQKYCYDTF